MRRLGCWKLQATLLAAFGLACTAAASETGDADAKAADKDTSPGWLQWLTPGSKKPDKKPVVKAGEDAAKKADVAEDAAGERAREMAAYLRRVAVCDRLMEVAAERHDDALLKQAEELSNRAYEVYSRRVAHLPASSAGKPLGEASAEKSKDGYPVLRDHFLDSDRDMGDLQGGAGSTGPKDRKGLDSPKEEMP